jgi:hypothetical protein
LTAEHELILLADNSKRLSSTKGKGDSALEHGIELEFYGNFPSVWDGKPDSEILDAAGAERLDKPDDSEIRTGRTWFPGTKELREFAEKGRRKNNPEPEVMNDLRGFLYTLGKKKPGTISRLYLFTHASEARPGQDAIIGLSGRVILDNVVLERGQNALDDFAMEQAEEEVFGLKTMTKQEIYAQDITITNVREAFRNDAEVVIYACHSGLDQLYLNKIAKLFGVKVRGFKKMIRYTLVPDKNHTHIVKRTYGIEGSKAEYTDFHSLTADVSSR